MILPRISVFKSLARQPAMTHLVMVDGANYKAVCVRQPFKNGYLVPETTEVLCKACFYRGWTHDLVFSGSGGRR